MGAEPVTATAVELPIPIGGRLPVEEFRARVRAWLAANIPEGWAARMRGASKSAYIEFQREWFDRLLAAGLAMPHWPERWGGGASLEEQVVIFEEMARARAPRARLFQFSLYHLAGTLFHAGTPEQLERFIPAVSAGQLWCQGFSEPNAGSDLASLSTRAEKREGHYIVNGQKIWASWADHADWCLLLARTDPAASKHRGISFFLLDLRLPGVDVRPIRSSIGSSKFSEIFLTDVAIPADCLVGEENNGWAIAQATLSSERGPMIVELSERLFLITEQLAAGAAATVLEDGTRAAESSAVRERIGGIYADALVTRALCMWMLGRFAAGVASGVESSIIKVFYSEALQEMTRFGLELAGLEAQLEAPISPGAGSDSGDWLNDFLQTWEWTVAGGTNEIQRNIIGERWLGLPREPRPAAAS